ncbi:hypothetical protein FEZ32_05400 [Acidipropionibacterium jensenii]|nr:hypothetical protein FEZ32_05400 [Acidipropionibacterium jensenii]
MSVHTVAPRGREVRRGAGRRGLGRGGRGHSGPGDRSGGRRVRGGRRFSRHTAATVTVHDDGQCRAAGRQDTVARGRPGNCAPRKDGCVRRRTEGPRWPSGTGSSMC